MEKMTGTVSLYSIPKGKGEVTSDQDGKTYIIKVNEGCFKGGYQLIKGGDRIEFIPEGDKAKEISKL